LGTMRAPAARPPVPPRDRHLQQDAGSVAIETAVLVPILGLMVLLIVFGGRLAIAHQAVQTAAFHAARAASLERDPFAARERAAAAARQSVAHQDLRCAGTDVVVDTGGLTAPVGTTSTVSATVTCHLDLSDLGVPFPGSRTVSATMTSAVDQYRERP